MYNIKLWVGKLSQEDNNTLSVDMKTGPGKSLEKEKDLSVDKKVEGGSWAGQEL